MEPAVFLEMIHIAEKLKNTFRHCYTSEGRHESVAEHSWRVTLMAFWLKGEFPEADMNKVIAMCIIHDLGEIFTGDIPVFNKTDKDRNVEADLLDHWVNTLPDKVKEEMKALYAEMNERKTIEAKLYKALDGLEALIQHNESDLSTWEDHEYDLQMKYAYDRVDFSAYIKEFRDLVKQESLDKIHEEHPEWEEHN